MVLEINVLEANHGDSIAIRGEFEGQLRNILIDGGPSTTFEYQGQSKPLQNYLNELIKREEVIDLLILTHVDQDHIAGLLSAFKKKGYLSDLTKEVWFNSGKLIFDHFNKETEQSNFIELGDIEGKNTSISEGVLFEDHITKLGVWRHELIICGQELIKFGINFKILSPSIDQLKKLLIKWEKESPIVNTSSDVKEYYKTFSELLLDDKFVEDNRPHNVSSLAFTFEYQDKNIVFLGDAPPTVVIDSLSKFGYSADNPLRADYVKISHHGSKKSTNEELLKLFDCNNYIISTDGSSHNLPNKVTLARITKIHPTANLMFNYPHLINQIFDKKELTDVEYKVSSCSETIIL